MKGKTGIKLCISSERQEISISWRALFTCLPSNTKTQSISIHISITNLPTTQTRSDLRRLLHNKCITKDTIELESDEYFPANWYVVRLREMITRKSSSRIGRYVFCDLNPLRGCSLKNFEISKRHDFDRFDKILYNVFSLLALHNRSRFFRILAKS